MAQQTTKHAALVFIEENNCQILQKARKYGVEVEDFQQDVALFIVEHADKYDRLKGTFPAFVFGSLGKIMVRQLVSVHRFVHSLSDESETGRCITAQVEAIEHPAQQEGDTLSALYDENVSPEIALIRDFADKISGKSVSDIALEMGLTRRRVNQILASLCARAATLRKENGR